jgi:hypothetical protein
MQNPRCKDRTEERKVRGDHRNSLPTISANPNRQRAELVDSKAAAVILGRAANTLKRWRYEGIGPEFVAINDRPRYDLAVLHEFIVANTRMPSVRAAMERIRGNL